MLPFANVSDSSSLLSDPKKVKKYKDYEFDPDKLVTNEETSGFVPRQVVYCGTKGQYATIVKPGDKKDTFVCKLKQKEGQAS